MIFERVNSFVFGSIRFNQGEDSKKTEIVFDQLLNIAQIVGADLFEKVISDLDEAVLHTTEIFKISDYTVISLSQLLPEETLHQVFTQLSRLDYHHLKDHKKRLETILQILAVHKSTAGFPREIIFDSMGVKVPPDLKLDDTQMIDLLTFYIDSILNETMGEAAQIKDKNESFLTTFSLTSTPVEALWLNFSLRNTYLGSDDPSESGKKPEFQKEIKENDEPNAISGEKDQSMIGMEAPGGIDFNPALFDMQIKRGDDGVPLPLDQQPPEIMDIPGIIPVIIQIQTLDPTLFLSSIQ